MHKTIAAARELVRSFLAQTTWEHPEVDVVMAPPFTALFAVAEELAGSTVALGAQTMHWADQGACTGEISPPMLLEIGCKFVILGHSERRAACGEIDHTVNLKVKSALAHGLTPVVAVGETQSEHDAGLAKERVTAQVTAALLDVSSSDKKRCVIAYEPIWAIGSGKADDPASANAVMSEIRDCDAALGNIQILYGGSVKPANIASFMAQPNIDGGLVGGASIDAAIFAELVRNARPVVKTP